MDLERLRRMRAGVLGIAVTLLLAAGATAAYSLSGRRAPAAAHVPAEPVPAPVTLVLAARSDTVVNGSRVTIDGDIADEWGSPLPGRTVEVLTARVDAPNRVRVVARPTSDADGRVSASFRPPARSAVWLRFPGEEGLADGRSDAVTVDVARRVTVVSRTVATEDAWRTTFKGSVRPAGSGQRVRLERRVGASWRMVAATRVTRKGTYEVTVRRGAAGTFQYRVVVPAAGGYARGVGFHRLRLRPPVAQPPRGNGGPGSLLVTGDSFAYYLGQQLAAARRPRATTVDSRHSSGLARPEFLDWNDVAPGQLAAAKPGAVVVFLGANDCQPIRVGGTGRWAVVGSAAWVAEYRRRATELISTYAAGGARPVYWVGLPIVERPDIAACYRAMNGATRAATGDVRGASWIESWSLYAVDGKYSATVRGVLARQPDGIHLTFAGTRFLTRKVYALLRP